MSVYAFKPDAVSGEPETEKKGRYILIVDDEHRIIRSLTRELSDWAKSRGYSVTGTVLGQLALEFIEAHRSEVELVIADIRMPGMSGGDMVSEINRHYPEIKIVVLTAYNDVEEISKAKFDSFVAKPWEPEHLLAEVERVLQ